MHSGSGFRCQSEPHAAKLGVNSWTGLLVGGRVCWVPDLTCLVLQFCVRSALAVCSLFFLLNSFIVPRCQHKEGSSPCVGFVGASWADALEPRSAPPMSPGLARSPCSQARLPRFAHPGSGDFSGPGVQSLGNLLVFHLLARVVILSWPQMVSVFPGPQRASKLISRRWCASGRPSRQHSETTNWGFRFSFGHISTNSVRDLECFWPHSWRRGETQLDVPRDVMASATPFGGKSFSPKAGASSWNRSES